MTVLLKQPDFFCCYFDIGDIHNIYFNDKYSAIEYLTKGIELALKIGKNEYAGWGYYMRSNLKQELGDQNGYINDLKKGAELNNLACKGILEILSSMNSQ